LSVYHGDRSIKTLHWLLAHPPPPVDDNMTYWSLLNIISSSRNPSNASFLSAGSLLRLNAIIVILISYTNWNATTILRR